MKNRRSIRFVMVVALICGGSCVAVGVAGQREEMAYNHLQAASGNDGHILRVSRSVMHPSWLPDNRRVVVSMLAGPIKRPETVIAILHVDTGDIKVLSEPDKKHCYPVCSGDGTKIAYSGRMGEYSTIWVMDVDGGNKRPLADVRSYWRPAWSPDGRLLAFTERNSGIWIVNVDGSGLKLLARSGRNPKWSPDGKLVAYRNGVELRAIKPDGSGDRLLIELTADRSRGIGQLHHENFDWSHDGREIVYTYRPARSEGRSVSRDGDVRLYQVWVADVSGSKKRCLTPDALSCGLPTWVPGRRCAAYLSMYSYVVTARGGPPDVYPKQDIWMVSVDDLTRRQLTDRNETMEFPIFLDDGQGKSAPHSFPRVIREYAVSPNGNRIVITSDRRLFVLEI